MEARLGRMMSLAKPASAEQGEMVDHQGRIDPDAYVALYARRLLPGFCWIEERA